MSQEMLVSMLLLKESELQQAIKDLSSTDRATFDAAQLTLQRLIHKAIATLTLDCEDCDLRAPAQFCELHAHMFHETEIMLSDECDDPDKPVFQGI